MTGEFQYEAYRRSAYAAPLPWNRLDYLLLDLKTGEPVAGLEPYKHLQGSGFDFQFKPLVVRNGYEGEILANFLLFF